MCCLHPTYKGAIRVVPVELITAANEGSYSFPDKSQFRGPYQILGFSHRAYHADRRTNNNKTLVNDAVIKCSHIHIVQNSSDEIMTLPLEEIISDLTGYKNVYWIPPILADFNNSKITVANVSAISAGQAFELLVYVTDEGQFC